jgi:enterochelin esterase-like enzyme
VKAFFKIAVIELTIAAGVMASGCRAQPAAVVPTPLPSPTPQPTLEPAATPLPIPTLTPTPEPCIDTQGSLRSEMFTSQITGADFHYRVYLPPCYASTGRRYPLLVMLHGYVENSDAMNDDQWVRLGLADAADKGYATRALPPMVILMPNGLDASYGRDDSPVGKVITSELLPDASHKFCVWGDAARQAIGGLSRGGFWALSIAFLNPGLFGKVGGHSPFVYDGDFPDQNPLNLLDAPIDLKGLSIYVDHGAQDYAADGARELVARLKAHGLQPQYVVNPVGTHSEDYWSAHVADYLAFYGADWPKDVSQYPACAIPQ